MHFSPDSRNRWSSFECIKGQTGAKRKGQGGKSEQELRHFKSQQIIADWVGGCLVVTVGGNRHTPIYIACGGLFLRRRRRPADSVVLIIKAVAHSLVRSRARISDTKANVFNRSKNRNSEDFFPFYFSSSKSPPPRRNGYIYVLSE